MKAFLLAAVFLAGTVSMSAAQVSEEVCAERLEKCFRSCTESDNDRYCDQHCTTKFMCDWQTRITYHDFVKQRRTESDTLPSEQGTSGDYEGGSSGSGGSYEPEEPSSPPNNCIGCKTVQ